MAAWPSIDTFFLQLIHGGQNRPSNPATALDVQIDEPLKRRRTLLEGGERPAPGTSGLTI